MALDVVGTVPVLVLGDQEQLKGEVWLSNPSAADIAVEGATLSVSFPSGTETGVIQIPSDSAVGGNASKRLLVSFGIQPATPPGTYAGSIDLQTSAGPQSIAASIVVGRIVLLAFGTPPQVFSAVAAGATITSNVVVMNRGNVSFTVGDIPDESLFEVVATPRLLTVGTTGVVSVAPSTGLEPLAQELHVHEHDADHRGGRLGRGRLRPDDAGHPSLQRASPSAASHRNGTLPDRPVDDLAPREES